MGWYLYGVKIVLLLFNVSTHSNPYQAKLTRKLLALSSEKHFFCWVNRQSVCTWKLLTELDYWVEFDWDKPIGVHSCFIYPFLVTLIYMILGVYLYTIHLKNLHIRRGGFCGLTFFFTLAHWQDCHTLFFSQYPIMSNHSTEEIQAKAIRVLTGMLPMLNATDSSNQANTTGDYCVCFVLH